MDSSIADAKARFSSSSTNLLPPPSTLPLLSLATVKSDFALSFEGERESESF